MLTVDGVLGFTDGGRPVILPESRGTCFCPRRPWGVADKRCWNCKWANFGSDEKIVLLQGICHNPETWLSIEGDILAPDKLQGYAQQNERKEEPLCP